MYNINDQCAIPRWNPAESSAGIHGIRCFLPCLSSIFMKFQRSSKSSKSNASKLSRNMYNDVQCTYKQLLFFLFHHRYFTKDLFLEKTMIQQLHQFHFVLSVITTNSENAPWQLSASANGSRPHFWPHLRDPTLRLLKCLPRWRWSFWALRNWKWFPKQWNNFNP